MRSEVRNSIARAVILSVSIFIPFLIYLIFQVDFGLIFAMAIIFPILGYIVGYNLFPLDKKEENKYTWSGALIIGGLIFILAIIFIFYLFRFQKETGSGWFF